MGDQSVARPLPTHGATKTQNKSIQTSMPQVRFEPTIPVFQPAKTVHALDRAATVTGHCVSTGNGGIALPFLDTALESGE
jgi:hypothetical protein